MKKSTFTLLLSLGITGAMMGGPAGAAVHPLSEFTVFGRHGVMIGVGSTVKAGDPKAPPANLVGACGPSSLPADRTALCFDTGDPGDVPPGAALTMNGGAVIEGNALIFGNNRLSDGLSQIHGKLVSMGEINGHPNPSLEDPIVGDDHAPPEIHALLTLAKAFLEPIFGPAGQPDVLKNIDDPGPINSLICPSAGPSLTGKDNKELDLAPGVYGDITFGSHFTLKLGPGVYIFNSIKTDKDATIEVKQPGTAPGTRVIVCEAASFGFVTVKPDDLEHTDFTVLVGSDDQENAFQASASSHWRGDVLARGGIHIGSGGAQASVFGRLLAGGKVDIEHGVVVQATGCCGQNSPSKDATLLHSAKNQNNGANNILLVKSQVAAVVGFDVSGRDLSNVTSAQLVLRVCNRPADPDFCPENAPDSPIIKDFTPRNWPAAGAPVVAYQLNDGFEDWGSGIPPTSTPPEGNGNNFPQKGPYGSGAGVTWNCSIDSDVANLAMDCDPALYWNGGLLQQRDNGTKSDSVISNGLADGTPITFDVTEAVQAGLGPLDKTFLTWFIRTNTGIVSFYSLQGAKALAPGDPDPPLAPKLKITP